MENKKGILDIVKYRWVWLALSAVLLIPGIVAMGYSTVVNKAPLLLGIDFTGGTMLQYGFDKQITKEDEGKIRTIVTGLGIDNPVIQTSAPVVSKVKEEVKESTSKVKENASETEKVTTTETVKEEQSTEKTQYVVSIKTRYLETTEEKSEAAEIF